MKRIFNIFAVAALASLALVGCKKATELDTNQYEGTSLASYGPNPVMRGGTLTFYGANLDKVVKAIIPDGVEVTDIEVVKSGNPSEIRVKLPVDGIEPGKVTLLTSDGTSLTTKSSISYSEPIVFDSFSPSSAMPGDVITITGDYLNLVAGVFFADNVYVLVNEGSTRYKATVTVPAQAITGPLILSDGATIPNLMYSEDELTIGDPTVSGLKIATAKPGEDAVISGKYLQMIQSVIFADDVIVDVADFTLNEGNTTLTVAIPSTAKAGDVICVSYAGKEFTAGQYSPVTPSNLSVSPSPVKAGATLTISGKDLDIVTDLSFPGAGSTSFNYKDNAITVTVPAKATEGDITLTMANGDAVTVAYTLVHPTVTKVAPTTLTAGQTITVTGTDLDLITSATLGGKDVEITSKSASSLEITTAATSVSGALVLKLDNGEEITAAEEITLNYEAFIQVTDMPASAHIGETITLTGVNFMMIENIYIGDTKVTEYSVREDGTISFIVPYMSAPAFYDVTFELLNGDKEVCPQQLEVLLELSANTIWKGNFSAGNWSGMQDLAYGNFDWSTVKAGSTLRFYLTADTSAPNPWYQMSLRVGDSWADFNPSVYLSVGTDITYIDYVLTQQNIDDLINKNGLVVTGYFFNLTQIDLITEISQKTYLWQGNGLASTNWSTPPGVTLTECSNTDKLVAGATIGFDFYCDTTVDDKERYWQVEYLTSWWTSLPFGMVDGARKQWEYTESDTNAEFTLTQADIDQLNKEGGFVFGGHAVYITGIYVK